MRLPPAPCGPEPGGFTRQQANESNDYFTKRELLAIPFSSGLPAATSEPNLNRFARRFLPVDRQSDLFAVCRRRPGQLMALQESLFSHGGPSGIIAAPLSFSGLAGVAEDLIAA
jgi:hypothetical protein